MVEPAAAKGVSAAGNDGTQMQLVAKQCFSKFRYDVAAHGSLMSDAPCSRDNFVMPTGFSATHAHPVRKQIGPHRGNPRKWL